jgi:hypothetical protein
LSTHEDSPLKATDFGLSVFFKPGDCFMVNWRHYNYNALKLWLIIYIYILHCKNLSYHLVM